jgi:hypothetical protein
MDYLSSFADTVKNFDYSIVHNNAIINNIKNFNYTGLKDNAANYIPQFPQDIHEYNPLNKIGGYLGGHICLLFTLLMVSLWISTFVMFFLCKKSVKLCDMVTIIFLTLVFAFYMPMCYL